MPDYTDPQAEAIACLDEPLQIIACAGSGKTQVISQRIANILQQPGVEPRNVIAFTFTEKAAAELKDRIHGILQSDGVGTQGIAEMYVGTMHGYTLDLLQRLVPETFKYSVLTEITARLFVDRNSRKSRPGDLPNFATGKAAEYLRRYQNSKLYLQAMSVLREDDVDWDLVPPGVVDSSDLYLRLLHNSAYFGFTEMISLAVQFLEEWTTRMRTSSSGTSAKTSGMSSSMSIRTSTLSRSVSLAASRGSAPTSVLSETTTRRSTSGEAVRSPTSSPLRIGITRSGR